MAVNLKNLRDSNEFLNVLLDNINSAVLIVNSNFLACQFNNALKMIFGRKEGELSGRRCGEALGCVFAVEEKAPCGETSQCYKCQLRKSIANTFRKKNSAKRKIFAHTFYVNKVPVKKFLEYSTRYIQFDGQELALVIMEDITDREVQKQELIRKQKQLDSDLKAAASIQRMLLPPEHPRCERINAAWQFLPCSSIGGDIFNLIHLDGGQTGCYIMDVSGHGIHSALVAVSVSQLLHPDLSGLSLTSPAAVCKELESHFPLERFNVFFSIIYLVLDPPSGTIRWCNAGHPPAVLVHRSGGFDLLEACTTIIGLGEIPPRPESTKPIQPGDRIYLYTDGLIERRDENGDFFGLDRFVREIKEVSKEPLAASVSSLLSTVMAFGGDASPADDMSLLGLELR